MRIIKPLYLKNKLFQSTGEDAFILETGAVANAMQLGKPVYAFTGRFWKMFFDYTSGFWDSLIL
jgi:hypothetical protein